MKTAIDISLPCQSLEMYKANEKGYIALLMLAIYFCSTYNYTRLSGFVCFFGLGLFIFYDSTWESGIVKKKEIPLFAYFAPSFFHRGGGG